MTHPVVVIGGGISGLVAAHRLHRAGMDVTVIEASDRLGGKVLTTGFAGGRVEMGPDSFLARDPILLDLCDELGLSDELIPPVGFGAQVSLEDGLRRLPVSTYFGIPLHVPGARRTGILTGAGALRARIGSWFPQRRPAEDVAVGAFVRSRFGRQVLGRMVDPVLAGTRAGDPDEISLRAALPEAWDALSNGRRLTSELRRQRSGDHHAPPPFFGLRAGMHRLVDALVDALPRFTPRTHVTATGITAADDHYVVGTSVGELEASGVIVAAPPRAAATMLEGLSDEAAAGIGELSAVDVAIATYAYDGELELPEGSGLLVPASRNKVLTGATWYSRKWPHAVPPGTTVIRCFAGRTQDHRMPEDHDELLQVMHDQLSDAVGGLPEPVARQGIRWSAALPIYRVGHLERVEAIEQALAEHPRVRLAGAAYRGSGLPDCARGASEAAAGVAGELGATAR